jgi:hypothetical protein
MLSFPLGFCRFFAGLGQRFSQHLFGNSSTGLADGRQLVLGSFIRLAGVHLGHQQTVHYNYEIHVPGQALRLYVVDNRRGPDTACRPDERSLCRSNVYDRFYRLRRLTGTYN